MKIDESINFELKGKIYNIKKLSVLQNFKKEDLKKKPYYHLVIQDCLDQDIYDHLEKNYPSDEDIFYEEMKYKTNLKMEFYNSELNRKNIKNKEEIKRLLNEQKNIMNKILNKKLNMKSNIRYELPSINKDKYDFLDPIWKLFIDYHNSKLFIEEIKNVFGNKFTNFYNIKYKIDKNKNLKSFNDLSIGVRKKNIKKQETDFVTDVQIGINSPCINDSYVRGPHIDDFNEVYAGLLYFKRDNEECLGGNLKIFDTLNEYNNLNEYQKSINLLEDGIIERHGSTFRRKNEFNRKDLKLIDEIKYNKNVFVLFINDINAIHGISIRKKSNVSRRLVNIIGECYIEDNNIKKLKAPIWFK